jgi:hypothetical protein
VDVVVDAIRHLPPPIPGVNAAWDENSVKGQVDPNADLSAVVVSTVGATTSSPQHVLLFHRGVYQHTATLSPYPWATINPKASTMDTVVIDYRYIVGSESNAEAAGRASIRFRWAKGVIDQLDPIPAVMHRPPFLN